MKRIIRIGIVAVFSMALACNAKKDNTYANNHNPAEHAAEPGDKGKKNSETGEEAKARGLKEGDTKSASTNFFVRQAGEAGMTEVTLGKLAEKKGTSPAVKAFAKSMITDHSKANEELKALAAKKGIVLGDSLCGPCQEKFEDLSSLSGAAFDKRYAEMMVTDHQEVVAKFSSESTDGNDEEIRTWASQKLPVLKHHLSMAETMHGNVKR